MGAAGERDGDKAPEFCHGASAGMETKGHLLGHGGGLPFLQRRDESRADCPHLFRLLSVVRFI